MIPREREHVRIRLPEVSSRSVCGCTTSSCFKVLQYGTPEATITSHWPPPYPILSFLPVKWSLLKPQSLPHFPTLTLPGKGKRHLKFAVESRHALVRTLCVLAALIACRCLTAVHLQELRVVITYCNWQVKSNNSGEKISSLIASRPLLVRSISFLTKAGVDHSDIDRGILLNHLGLFRCLESMELFKNFLRPTSSWTS